MSTGPWANKLHAYAASLLATGLVAAFMASPGGLFLSNFAFFWLPAVVAISLVAVCRAPAHFNCGVAGGICAILLLYHAWVQTIPVRDSALVWAGYLLSMPGAIVAALASLFWIKARPATNTTGAIAAFAATATGFAVSMGVLLNSP